MKRIRVALAAGLFTAALGASAWAAGMWSTLPIVGNGSFCGSTVTGTGGLGGVTGQGQGSTGSICGQTVPPGPSFLTTNMLIPADSPNTNGAPPQTLVVPVGLLANMSGTPRNYLDNGSMNIQQRGTGTVTCGTTSGVPATAYGPDRWGCIANVTSGAGRQSLVTTAALLPAGFQNVNTLFRTSGALTQPICSIQEIPSTESTALAGQTVTLSVFAAALAGLAADNGNVITASIVTGTGSDQGLGTFTASPAITPAWTGVATPLNQAATTITTTPTRYALGTVALASTVTEVAVELCFTPTATGAGATDGFAFTGVQLEVAPGASAYEVHPVQFDLAKAQRFAYSYPEAASGVAQFNANVISATVCEAVWQFPVPMRAAPTLSQVGVAIAGGTTYKANSSTAGLTNVSAMATKVANSVNAASINFTSAGMTAGQACTIEGLGGGAIPLWSADF